MTLVAPITGQEAAVCGTLRGLDLATDWVVPYYRELLGLGALALPDLRFAFVPPAAAAAAEPGSLDLVHQPAPLRSAQRARLGDQPEQDQIKPAVATT